MYIVRLLVYYDAAEQKKKNINTFALYYIRTYVCMYIYTT